MKIADKTRYQLERIYRGNPPIALIFIIVLCAFAGSFSAAVTLKNLYLSERFQSIQQHSNYRSKENERTN